MGHADSVVEQIRNRLTALAMTAEAVRIRAVMGDQQLAASAARLAAQVAAIGDLLDILESEVRLAGGPATSPSGAPTGR